MQVVAKKGFSATLVVAKKSITITQFEAVDLSIFTQEQIDNSNFSVLFENGWIEEFKNQKLPTGPILPKIPIVKSVVKQGEKDTSVHVSVSKVGDRVTTEVNLPKDLPEELHARVEAAKEAEAANVQQHAIKVEESRKKENKELKMKPLKTSELARPIMVDGKLVTGSGFKLPKVEKSEEPNSQI